MAEAATVTTLPIAEPARAVLRDSIEFSASRKQLMLARLKAQAAFMKGAARDRANPFAKSKYATLESVLEAVAEPMTSNGLVLTQWAGEIERGGAKGERVTLYVYTRIEHAETSEYMQVFLPVALAKDDAQGIGSAMTYGRRYTLKAALGIPEVDDDGAAASGQESELRPKRKSSAEAKRDGTTEKFNEIKQAIASAINPEMLRHIGEVHAEEVEEMPEKWRQLLREEFELKRDELRAVSP